MTTIDLPADWPAQAIIRQIRRGDLPMKPGRNADPTDALAVAASILRSVA